MKFLVLLGLLVGQVHAQDSQSERAVAFFKETAISVITSLGPSHLSLLQTLKSGTIEARPGELVDNGGSLVDAIGVKGKVTLSQESWIRFLREGRDVRLQALHEVLRMAGIDDDNYRVSRSLLPREKTVLELRPYCDLRVSQTIVQRVSKSIVGVGYAAPLFANVFISGMANPDPAQANAQKAAEQDLVEKCAAAGLNDNVGYRSGMLSQEKKNVNGRRTMVFKITLQGVCQGNQTVRRDKALQAKEGCAKAALCRDLIETGVLLPLEAADQSALEKNERSWRCQ